MEDQVVQPWREQRRQAILAAAAGLFGAAAFDAVQMHEVARRAGVGKATLYRYFPSKEELYLAVFDHILAELEGRLTTIAVVAAPPRARLEAMLDALLTTLSSHILSLSMLNGTDNYGERWRRVLRDRSQVISDHLAQVLADGAAAGVFRPLDLRIVPTLIIGMVRGGIMADCAEDPAVLATSVFDFILNGALAPTPLPPVTGSTSA